MRCAPFRRKRRCVSWRPIPDEAAQADQQRVGGDGGPKLRVAQQRAEHVPARRLVAAKVGGDHASTPAIACIAPSTANASTMVSTISSGAGAEVVPAVWRRLTARTPRDPSAIADW